MALARRQSTGKATADNSTSVSATFATRPRVGNGVVVGVVSSAGDITGTCVDNFGNTYTLATKQGPAVGTGAVAIFVCARVTITGSSFTVTVPSGVGAADLMAVAVEVQGVAGGLAVDVPPVGAGGSGTTVGEVTTITTPEMQTLVSSNLFVMAVIAIWAAQTTLVAVAADPPTPAWTEEAEELPMGPVFPGEIDTRVLTGVAGTSTKAVWTLTPGGWTVVAIAAFKASSGSAGPPPPRSLFDTGGTTGPLSWIEVILHTDAG